MSIHSRDMKAGNFDIVAAPLQETKKNTGMSSIRSAGSRPADSPRCMNTLQDVQCSLAAGVE